MEVLSGMVRTGNGGPLAIPLAVKKAFDLAILILAGDDARASRLTKLLPTTAELLGITAEDETDAILDQS